MLSAMKPKLPDAAFAAIQDILDAELAKRTKRAVGIKFGFDLYSEFSARGLFAEEVFSVDGSGAFSMVVWAYEKKHAVWLDLGLGGFEFEVGADA